MRGIGWTAAVAVVLSLAAGTAPVLADDTVGLVNPNTGEWLVRNGGFIERFYFGNPADFPIMGDWDCDGVDTAGMYRQSDGFVYLSNANRSQVADIRFFFGNPGDVPIAGDFDGDGCDTVSIYRPSEGRFFIINELGKNRGGLGAAEIDYLFGDPGDKPFVGDFDGDGMDTIGLHRESTGLVYFRQSHTQGAADTQFIFGDPGDRLVAGDWNQDGIDTPALYRPIAGGDMLNPGDFYFRFTNTQGNADVSFCFTFGWPQGLPISGDIGKRDPFENLFPCRPPAPPPPVHTFGNGVWVVNQDIVPGTYRMLSDGTSCYWARLSGFSGEIDDIIVNEVSYGVEIVEILPSDVGFESSRCNQWSTDLSPRRPDPSAAWRSDGHVLVGSEISAGTWRFFPTAVCYWERLSGFSGQFRHLLANDFTTDPGVVTVSRSDAALYADDGCGTWTKIG